MDAITPSEQLGEAIAELAARIDAATYELLVLIERFDTCAGWNNGFQSCAHWLNWRIGIDFGAAREKVRVARALPVLPAVSDAMRRGAVFDGGAGRAPRPRLAPHRSDGSGGRSRAAVPASSSRDLDRR